MEITEFEVSVRLALILCAHVYVYKTTHLLGAENTVHRLLLLCNDTQLVTHQTLGRDNGCVRCSCTNLRSGYDDANQCPLISSQAFHSISQLLSKEHWPTSNIHDCKNKTKEAKCTPTDIPQGVQPLLLLVPLFLDHLTIDFISSVSSF